MFASSTLLSLAAVAVFSLTTAAWFRRAMRVAIPDDRSYFLGLWGLGGVLGISSFFADGLGWVSGSLATLTVVGTGLILGLYAFRKQGVGDPISVGDEIPEFVALDDSNTSFASTQLTGAPTLIKFFRGHW